MGSIDLRTVYDVPVLKLLSAPVTNDRSPRYMERALAAIHQAERLGEPITLRYGNAEDRVALFIECADHLEERVVARVVTPGTMIENDPPKAEEAPQPDENAPILEGRAVRQPV